MKPDDKIQLVLLVLAALALVALVIFGGVSLYGAYMHAQPCPKGGSLC